MSGARVKIGTLVGHLMAYKSSRDETERPLNNVQYELDGTRGRITQLTTREARHQEQVDRIIRRSGRVQAGADKISGQLIEYLKMKQVAYLIY